MSVIFVRLIRSPTNSSSLCHSLSPLASASESLEPTSTSSQIRTPASHQRKRSDLYAVITALPARSSCPHGPLCPRCPLSRLPVYSMSFCYSRLMYIAVLVRPSVVSYNSQSIPTYSRLDPHSTLQDLITPQISLCMRFLTGLGRDLQDHDVGAQRVGFVQYLTRRPFSGV